MKLVVAEPVAGRARIHLAGRFDAHEVEVFRAAVADVRRTWHTVVSIDLEEVVFIDSSALAELVTTSRQLQADGTRMQLANPSDVTRVILELTGLLAAFHIVERTVEGAGTAS